MKNRPLKGVLAMLSFVALAVGSYASVHSPPTEKAKPGIEVLQATTQYDVNCTVVTPYFDSNNVGILCESVAIEKVSDYFIPLQIGTVINKPIGNYRWLNCQHWYCSTRTS